MIDTIRVAPNLITNIEVEELRKNETGRFRFSATEHKLPHSEHSRWTVRGRDDEKLIRVQFDEDSNLSALETSLPGLLSMQNGVRQGNGIQLKTPEDLDAAKAATLMNVRRFCPQAEMRDLTLARIDLALTVKCNPRELLAVLRNARHRRVHRETKTYRNSDHRTEEDEGYTTWHRPGAAQPMEDLNTVRFEGARTVIQIYDKVRETKSKNGKRWPDEVKCTRIEIQLKDKKHVAKLFGRDEDDLLTLADLEFEKCYHLFRDNLCDFDRVAERPAFDPNIASLLAVLESCQESWKYLGGIRPLDWWRLSKNLSDKSFKALRLDVGRLVLQLSPFFWHEILPPDRLPDLVDVDGEGREIFVPSPWSISPQAQTPKQQ